MLRSRPRVGARKRDGLSQRPAGGTGSSKNRKRKETLRKKTPGDVAQYSVEIKKMQLKTAEQPAGQSAYTPGQKNISAYVVDG